MNCATRFKTSATPTALLSLLMVFVFSGIAPSQTISGLKYDWKVGDEYFYDVEIESEYGGEVDKKTGSLTYRVKRQKLDGLQEEDTSGTAFVISSDGYLATCAHVVGEAKKVDVVLNGREMVAKVVEVNAVLDLALLKVDASSLRPIPLADSAKVLQGSKINAFGFPLSDVLGEKLKVTTGVVSGFMDNVGGCRNLQFDAKVNPGNSGGPLVGESGNCLGIVISKLSGIAVSEVGFAVPSSEIVKLLKKHSKQPLPKINSQAIANTDLVSAMNSSVAMVRVNAKDHSKAFQIDWAGNLGPESGKGKLFVDNNGEISDLTGELDLPLLFGPLARIAIEPLGGSTGPRWESLQQMEFAYTYTEPKRSTSILDRYRTPPGISRYSRPSSRYRTPSPSRPSSRYGAPSYPRPRYSYPYDRRTESTVKVNTFSAIERTVFERQTTTDGRVLLKKKFEFLTTESETSPFLSLGSAGTIEFDPQQHMPISAEFNGTLKVNVSGKSISVPVKLTYRKVEKAVVDARKKKAAEALKKSREAAKKRATVPDPEAVKALIAKMNSDSYSISSEVRQLKLLAPVDELSDEVFEVLQKRSKDESFSNYQLGDVFEVLDKYGFSNQDKMELLVSILESSSKKLDHHSMGLLLKMPVADQYRDRVLKLAESMLNGNKQSYHKREAKKLLAKWAKGDDDASLILLANVKKSLNSSEATYQRTEELKTLLKVEFSDATRTEATQIAEKALQTSGRDTTMRDTAAKLVMHCATPEDQLSIFCDYLVDVENKLGDEEMKKVYGMFTSSKSKLAQQVLIVRLKKQNYNKFESKALIKMGSDCEDMLLKAYEKLPAVKPALPEILEFVGTEKSIPVMERLELDCHESYKRGQIHDSRVRMLKRLQVDSTTAGGKGDGSSNAANKLGEMFGD